MSFIWGSGGTTLFDYYSLQHIVWFVAITIVLIPIFEKHTWMAVLAVAFMWEVFEHWVVLNVPGFPFAGKEEFINKIVGDSISDLIGFLIALITAKAIRKQKYG
jgi:L-lactate permease